MKKKRIEEAQQFVDYMIMPSSSRPLSWKSPTEEYFLWLFWTEEQASNHASTSSDHQLSIQDRIKTALYDLRSFFYGSDVLVQFWAATTTVTDEGGAPRSVLTTADQPFALNRLTNEKLNHYKKNRPNYKLVEEGEEEHNLTDGSICRVFRTRLPEASADVSYYPVKEYPERDLALGCGIKSTLTLPVCEPSLNCCVGVLELLFTRYRYSLLSGFDIVDVIRAIKVAGLQTVYLWSKINDIPFIEEQELKVRETQGLPLVNIWTRSSLNKSFNTSDVVNFGEDFLYPIPQIEVYDEKSVDYYDFVQLTRRIPLRVGHGLVGKVFYSDKPYFCRDVSLSIIDYPTAHFARSLRFKSCFVVCLQSVATGNRVYALEFFLPPGNMHSGDLHNFLSSILTTLKQHLKSFKVVARDIGNDFFTEIDSFTEFNVEASMVKGKNVILAEQGNTSLTQNTLNTSSGQETTRLSTEFTSFHTLSLSNTYSGREFTSYKTISISAQGAQSGNETISSSGNETISSSGVFTSYKTMSISSQGAQDSARSLRSRSIESTLNNTARKLRVNTRPSGNQSYFDRSTSMISEHVHSETGSSTVFKLFGRTMTASQYQVPRKNAIRGDSSLSDGPRSEGSAVVPRTVPPLSTVDVEMVDVNENYEEGL